MLTDTDALSARHRLNVMAVEGGWVIRSMESHSRLRRAGIECLDHTKYFSGRSETSTHQTPHYPHVPFLDPEGIRVSNTGKA